MADTLKTLVKSGKLNGSALTVKVIKQISTNSHIVADKTMVAILDTHENPDHAKYLKAGIWYKLIKCSTTGDKSTIEPNKHFKPVKAVVHVDLGDIDEQVENIEKDVVAAASTKKYVDFQTLATSPNHSKVEKVTVKALTASRIISTGKGNYQICNIKDRHGNLSSINLYNKHLNALQPFNIFTITNLRKAEVTKNDETKMRLHTTGFTKIEEGSMEDVMNFRDVGNGEDFITGTIIGFGDPTTYNSCKQHYKKLDDQNKCPSCDKELKQEDTVMDFRTELYMEVTNEGENDVKEILMFKRVLGFEQDENIEEKLNSLTGKKAKIDFNTDNDQKFIAVSFEILQ